MVGDSAKDTASTNPKATISSLKTILGRRFRDPFVQSFATSVQYPIVDRNGLPHVRLDYKSKDGEDATLVVRFLHPFLLSLSLSPSDLSHLVMRASVPLPFAFPLIFDHI